MSAAEARYLIGPELQAAKVSLDLATESSTKILLSLAEETLKHHLGVQHRARLMAML